MRQTSTDYAVSQQNGEDDVLKIRLRREGSRNHPFFRIVVSDSRRTPRGPMVDILGHYDPKTTPQTVKVDLEKYDGWLGKGAQPSDTVRTLVGQIKKAGTA